MSIAEELPPNYDPPEAPTGEPFCWLANWFGYRQPKADAAAFAHWLRERLIDLLPVIVFAELAAKEPLYEEAMARWREDVQEEIGDAQSEAENKVAEIEVERDDAQEGIERLYQLCGLTENEWLHGRYPPWMTAEQFLEQRLEEVRRQKRQLSIVRIRQQFRANSK